MTISLKQVIFEEKRNGDFSYRGSHKAPTKESGAPIWDVTKNGTYPQDFYDSLSRSVKEYSFGQGGEEEIISLLFFLKGKPEALVKIYRAVPKQLSYQEEIDLLMKQKRYMAKTGKFPKDVVVRGFQSPSAYYSFISQKIEKLDDKILGGGGAPQETKDYKINPGDWVTVYKPYAAEHGRLALGNSYRIISKTVLANEVYISSDSVFEFSFIP